MPAFVLLSLQKTMGIRVTAVHVNHMLRGEEADADERFVEELCRQQNVPCRVFRIDVAKGGGKRENAPKEEAGREVRREAMRKVMVEEHAEQIGVCPPSGR